MKKEITIVGLALAITLGVFSITASAAEHTFADAGTTPSWEWAEDEIYEAYEEGIIQGKAGNIFDAEGKVTRAEAATMLVKWRGINPEEYGDTCEVFTDVKDGEWYTPFINAAYENGLIAGKGNGIFEPEGNLTRAEAAALLVTGSGWLADAPDVGFTDVQDAWYTSYINTANVHNVISGMGDGTYRPLEEVTRAQLVVMIESVWMDAEEARNLYFEYTYDESGKLLEEAHYVEEGRLSGTKCFVYDEKGVLVQSQYEHGDQIDVIDYFYDDHGRLIREVRTEGGNQGDWWCEEYIYGSGGELMQMHKSSSNLGIYRIIEYDEKGREKQITDYDKDGKQERMCKYAYSRDGAVCTETKTAWGTTSVEWTRESTYDEDGNLQEERYFYPTDYHNSCTRYTYDEEGNVIQIANYRQHKEDGYIHISDWYRYEYNDAGQCIRWSSYTYNIMPTW